MKPRLSTIGAIAAFLSMACLAAASAPAAARDSQREMPGPASRPAYTTLAPIALLKDADSGVILYSRRADEPFAPASMAKVMTAYVVLDLIQKRKISRDKIVTVNEATWSKWRAEKGSSTMFLRAGEKISIDALLKGLITVSGNDAATALAVEIDGSEEKFVSRMNEMAAAIGMKSSRFGTASGWPDGGVTKVSAIDLVTLASRLIREHPEEYARYFSLPQFEHGLSPDGKPIIQRNRNPILGRVIGTDGLKTGHTAEAGYCFLGSTKRDGRRLIMVVAGLDSDKARREEAERLMRWGFGEGEGDKAVSASPEKRAESKRPAMDSKAVGGNQNRISVPKDGSDGYREGMRSGTPLKASPTRAMPMARVRGVG